MDRLARWLIAAGGIGTIVAVSTVCVFLLWVVVPLFFPATLSAPEVLPTAAFAKAPLYLGVDEYRTAGCVLSADGELTMFRCDNGDAISFTKLLGERVPTTATMAAGGKCAVFGFEDGAIQLVKLRFVTTQVDPQSLPADIKELAPGVAATYDSGVLSCSSAGTLRLCKLIAEPQSPVEHDDHSPIRLIDYIPRPDGEIFCVLNAAGQIKLEAVSHRENLLTGDITSDVRAAQLPVTMPPGKAPPTYLLISGQGDNVYLAWTDGHLMRFDTSNFAEPKLAEEIDLLDKSQESLTALRFALGDTTLLAGDSSGRIRAWFRIKPPDAATCDGALLACAHTLSGHGSTVTDISPSSRTRMIAAGYADGSVRSYFLTNERLITEDRVSGQGGVVKVALPPKDDGLVALTNKAIVRWDLDPRHPEVSFGALFRPVWYEGYEAPSYVWQSTGGSDDFESKLSLIPLVFGTLKATFFSMLFGAPIALLAALYTSEFMQPGTKARLKPAIEMMASLPSVVLGFLAGLVIAPFVETVVPVVISAMFMIPLALLLGAHLWQLLPQRVSLRLGRWRFGAILLALPVGVRMASVVAPVVERLLFAGDLRAWLDGQVGSGLGGWVLLLTPLCAIFTLWLMSQKLNVVLRRVGHDWSRRRWATVDLAKFALGVVFTLTLATTLGLVLDALGFDPRGTFVGTYVQRNALVVGFVMGFAIIPIVYTIADDALSTVPERLRAASLGAGATPWQTATRIIIPTAMSGLFSAVMIGLGRAVGETMIVLMAAGNTSIMQLNVFNGFQTLSALIATEMPEAVRNSSHYRTLFLAALSLFALTFVVNTVAEVIRMRFRRRAYEL